MRWWALVVASCVVLAGCAQPTPGPGRNIGNDAPPGSDEAVPPEDQEEPGLPEGEPDEEPGNATAYEEDAGLEEEPAEEVLRPRAEVCPEGDDECLEERGLVVFRDAEDADEFREFRTEHLDPEVAPRARAVNWSNETVLVALGGQQPTRCPSVHLKEPQHRGNVTVVPVVLLEVHAFCPQALSYPTTTTVIEDPGTPIRWTFTTVPAHLVGGELWNFTATHLQPREGQVISGSPHLDVDVTPTNVTDGSRVRVNVTYDGRHNLTLQGPACGFHLARNASLTWEVFAHAAPGGSGRPDDARGQGRGRGQGQGGGGDRGRGPPGSQGASTRLATNGTCTAIVDLDRLRGEDHRPLEEGLPPGTYRVAVLGWEKAGERRTALMAWTTLNVTR